MNKIPARGMQVNLDEIRAVSFTCEPKRCRRGPKCCAAYEVRVSSQAIKRITGLMPQIVPYCPDLREGNGFANPFEESEAGEWVLEEDEDGGCALAYSDDSGAMWCAVHSAALDAGVNPWDWKPADCLLWPLALSEDAVPVLGIQEDADAFPCVQRRPRWARGLDAGIAEIIRRRFGAGAEAEILKGLETGCSTWNITGRRA